MDTWCISFFVSILMYFLDFSSTWLVHCEISEGNHSAPNSPPLRLFLQLTREALLMTSLHVITQPPQLLLTWVYHPGVNLHLPLFEMLLLCLLQAGQGSLWRRGVIHGTECARRAHGSSRRGSQKNVKVAESVKRGIFGKQSIDEVQRTHNLAHLICSPGAL